MRLRHLVTAAGIEQIDHRVGAENDPQPPTVAFFPVQNHENQPTAIPGDAKSLGNKGLRQRRFREVYVAGATGASTASEALDPRFSKVFLNYLSAASV